jgi:PGF-CTERM protein
VVARTDDGFRVDVAGAGGGPPGPGPKDYNITVPPGTHTVSVFGQGTYAPPKQVTATAETNTEVDFTLGDVEVERRAVDITEGPGQDANLGVRANVSQGLLQVQLVDERTYNSPSVGSPTELEGLGVNDSTQFDIDITVTNFTASSLLWALDDARWEATPNDTVRNGTDITITGSPVQLQANFSGSGAASTSGPLIRQDPSQVQWPTGQGDRATVGRNETVYVDLYDLSSVSPGVRSTINGVSTTTNAQRFSLPTVENESLRVWVAAPSRTVDGANHTGFYQATIPEAQLDAWGVSDPVTDLEALYKGQQRDFEVTDTAEGARIRIENISYSAGTVSIQTSPSAGDDDTPTTGGGDGGTPGRDTFSEGQARVEFGASSVRSVEVISPGASGTLDVRRLGTTFEDVPEPDGRPAIAGLDITAPDPSDTATVQITLSSSLLDRRVTPPENMTIQRYDPETGWESLNTTATDVDGGALLEAETDEFSVFAVTRDRRADVEADGTEATPAGTTTPEEETPDSAETTATDPDDATPAGTTTTDDPTPTPDDATPDPADGTQVSDDATPTEGAGPGFGVALAALAVLAAALLAVRRD